MQFKYNSMWPDRKISNDGSSSPMHYFDVETDVKYIPLFFNSIIYLKI